MPVWQRCFYRQVCTHGGCNALLPTRNKFPPSLIPHVILLNEVSERQPQGGLTTWQSWRTSPRLFTVIQASCWILAFLHAFHSLFCETFSHWSKSCKSMFLQTLVEAALTRPRSIPFYRAWRMPAGVESGRVVGTAWIPWKLTALLLSNSCVVNIPIWRLLTCNSFNFKHGRFLQYSSISFFFMFLCAPIGLTIGTTFKTFQVQFQPSAQNTKIIATDYLLAFQLTT